MSIYYGKDCIYFRGQWENEWMYKNQEYKDENPVLVFCTHPENKDESEGNCNPKQCPLKIPK